MRYNKEQKEAVRNKLIEMYPDHLDKLSTSQVMEAVSQLGWDTIPWSVVAKTDVRNIFTLKNIPNVVPFTQPVEAKSPKNANEVSLIPQVDSNYVAFVNHRDVENIIKSYEFYPTYITGPTGNGKSTMVPTITECT